jgi:gamma-glutamylcyclotransferase (GGCT)/AIG2-like uncharacterized protein YtfP
MLYFAYGMNTNQREMARRCARARSLGPAMLPDHELVISCHCDVRPRAQSQVQGVLWQITQQDLDQLDLLEGWPWYYDRDWVTVHAQDGSTVQALCYRMTEALEPSLPNQGYLNCVATGYRQHGLALTQLQQALDQIPGSRLG